MIAVVDYGMGNLRSVQKALQRMGGDAEIVSTTAELAKATKVVLPGVGAFADAIDRLRSTRLDEGVIQAIRRGTPFLGICLGFQLLFDVSYEDGEHTGLGILPGKVVRFDFPSSVTGQNLKIPHMGWNQIDCAPGCPLFAGIDNKSYVYFVHGYHAVTIGQEVVSAVTDYGYAFPSAVWSGNIFGTQFHPEKSQAVGLKMLHNFIRL
ncbi:MAG: imidazole glycerol phosphate synthase subunit HisH [Phycisphaerae bacterium]|nr:imidazole glycerol phosphate synthase subunit HisH [Phycisphaerae bacterium]